jgi:chorismate dehydratase
LDRKIRIAAVSYRNAIPLVYGFEKGMLKDSAELVFEYPAKLASLLLNDEADIALLPVAVLPSLKEYHIIADYCIGADGEVASVCLFSEVPIEEVTEIYLDYQSRSSVALLKILLKKYWKINPQLLESAAGFETQISGTRAGLIIGDRALEQRSKSTYIYDLATAWKELTGLPFVFAAWVANKKLPEAFIHDFNAATAEGLFHLREIADRQSFEAYDLYHYYTRNIQYKLDEEKRKAISLFLQYLSAEQ